MNTSDFLFTYGTLMQRFGNPFASKLRKASVFHGNGYFPGLLYRVSWYPGAIYMAGTDQRVYGEIYRVTDSGLWKDLDAYEDVLENESESLYLRKIVMVTMEDGTSLDCWTYLYNQSVTGLEKMEGGRF
ncbi:gamma-glutamylcyclotransferase family protein [Dyadobacter sp. 32]|uniref:gamma-glutamylcyclotransferase family protein n=1 Tax=Dyadobacter sp. 32 TaxID=538966 RepID=UPI0011ED64BF